MKLSSESVESIREVYGNLADHIGIRRVMIDGDDKAYELSVSFYKRFRTSRLDEEMSKHATIATAYDLCNTIDKMVLDRVPNRTTPHNQNMPGVKFHVSRNVPDGIVYISPRTYYEMMGRD